MESSWRPTTICISIFFLKQWVSKRSQNGTKPLLILFLLLFIFIKIQKTKRLPLFQNYFLSSHGDTNTEESGAADTKYTSS